MRIKKHLIYILLTFTTSSIFSQQYFYGGANDDFGRDVEFSPDNSLVSTGFTHSMGAGVADYYLAKTDLNGNMLWQKTFGGTQNEFARDIVITADMGIALVGYSESFGAGTENIYLVRTDVNGNTLWTQTYGGANQNQGLALDLNSDGGFIIAGYTNNMGAGSDDVYLIRTDSLGNMLWQKTYGGTNVDRAYAVKQTTSGGFILAGYTSSFSASYEFYLINTDANGDTLWTKRFGGISNDRSYAVQQTSDGGFIALGYTLSFGSGQSDVYIIKTDASGNIQWTKVYGGSTFDYGYAINQLPDNGYIIAGETESYGFGGGKPDMYIMRLDPVGDTLWTKTYGGPDWDYGRAICSIPGNNFAAIGAAENLSLGMSDIYLITIDSVGNPINGFTTATNNEIRSEKTFSLFPNPATGRVNINLNSPSTNSAQIIIFNAMGQLVYFQEHKVEVGSTVVQLNITQFTPGFYTVQVKQNNLLQSQKLIIH